MTVLPFCAHFVTLLIAAVYWSRRAARLHSSIRGLSPQAGGFRRRSITPASVNRVSGLAQVPIERLPCVQQVLTIHLLSVSYSNTRQSFNPRVPFPFQGNTQYNTNIPLSHYDVGALPVSFTKNQGGMDWAHSPGGRVDDEAVAADDGEGSDFNALAVRRSFPLLILDEWKW